MEFVPHAEQHWLLVPDWAGRDQQVLLCGMTGERLTLAGTAAQLEYAQDGFLLVQRAGKPPLEVAKVLKKHVVTSENGKFIQDMATKSSKYLHKACMEYDQAYKKLHFMNEKGEMHEMEFTIFKSYMPKHGAQIFVQLREFQDLT